MNHLSYSSLRLYEANREEFFLQRLCDAPKLPQERPAAAGSAFDAYAKSALYRLLFGLEPAYEFETLFADSVEPQNRDWARIAGQHLLDNYRASGAYDDLLELLRRSTTPPRFEFKVTATVGGVPIVGRPDCQFTLDDCRVLLDWKVRGYCSEASPTKGYMLCRDGAGWPKPSRSHNTQHKLFAQAEHRWLRIAAAWLETTEPDWADQLSLYHWLLGGTVGDESAVCMVDELVGKRHEPPLIRVAQHRGCVSAGHQAGLLARFVSCWEAVQSGTVVESGQGELLRKSAESLQAGDWFGAVTRSNAW